MIVLMQLKEPYGAGIITRKILEAFRDDFQVNQHNFQITVSVGISLFPNDSADPEILLKYADTAMYRVKNSGKNNYSFWRQA